MLLDPEEIRTTVGVLRRVLEELDRLLLGRRELHRMVLVGILSRGHLLLEGLPGVGKTELIKALGRLLDLDFRRIQFTPDLMPPDVLGTHILRESMPGTRDLVFEPGPVFTHILLADEINRASPKTQSALLEAMQERTVTLMGTTRTLPDPFFVLASQNPIELEGTYPLPEAQLDRFLFKVEVGGLEAEILEEIISTRRRGEPPACEWSLPRSELARLFDVMDRILLPRPVSRYIATLVAATHPGTGSTSDWINRYVSYGASPRAAIAMAEAARGWALLRASPSVGFDDVRAVAHAVLAHRLVLDYRARLDGVDAHRIVTHLLDELDVADLRLPAGVEVE